MNSVEQEDTYIGTPAAYPLHKGNIDRLISLAHEASHRMPSGLTREERKQWATGLTGRVNGNT